MIHSPATRDVTDISDSEVDTLVEIARKGMAAGDTYFDHMNSPVGAVNYVRVADLVQRYAKEPILDWGCGHGQVSWLLRNRGLQVESCDLGISTGGRHVPELKPVLDHVTVLTHEYQLPYAAESFGTVLSVGVLEHVNDFDKSLDEINRVLIPGGMFFLLMFPNKYSWAEAIQGRRGFSAHPFKFTVSSAQDLLDRHGFTVQTWWRRNFLPRNLAGLPSGLKRVYGRFWRTVEFADRILANVPPTTWFSGVIEAIAVKR